MAAPAVVFTYNRAKKTELTLSALNNNTMAPETELFIFNDPANTEKENDKQKVYDVLNILYDFKRNNNFRSVTIFRGDKHNGLAKSVISGVTKIINEYGTVIVTEDDLISHENYLEYMNNALNYYSNAPEIWSVSGYTYPLKPNKRKSDVYFTYRGSSWGWATWKDRWNTVDWSMKDFNTILLNPKRLHNLNLAGRDLGVMLKDQKVGNIDSWAVRWVFEQTRERKMTVYPAQTFLHNIGMDGSGSHGVNDGNDTYSSLEPVPYSLCRPYYSKEILNAFAEHYEDPYFHTVQKF